MLPLQPLAGVCQQHQNISKPLLNNISRVMGCWQLRQVPGSSWCPVELPGRATPCAW